MSTERKRRRRNKLWKSQDGLCHFCRRSTKLPTQSGGLLSDDVATLDHLRDKFDRNRGLTDNEEHTVMACAACNRARGIRRYEENRNLMLGNMDIMVLNLGLDNRALYDGCEIASVGKSWKLQTKPFEAISIIEANLRGILNKWPGRTEVTLTGPMAVWAYLTVFKVVSKEFKRVYYDDGRNDTILVCTNDTTLVCTNDLA